MCDADELQLLGADMEMSRDELMLAVRTCYSERTRVVDRGGVEGERGMDWCLQYRYRYSHGGAANGDKGGIMR